MPENKRLHIAFLKLTLAYLHGLVRAMSPLASAISALLRLRTSHADPRITYAQLAEHLRNQSDDFAHIYHRSRELYAALGEVGRECRRLRLPPLPALVVRADTGRPGAAYFASKRLQALYPDDRLAAWRRDVEAVRQAEYPRLTIAVRPCEP